jgi:HEAT repeat protein
MTLAVEKLVEGLKSSDAGMRTAAAKGLQMLQAPLELVAPEMIALVNDPHPDVQANAISAIASLGESVVPRVVGALQNPELRGPAVQVLIQLGPKAVGAVPALIDAAPGADPDLRAQIHFALASIGAGAAPATEMLAEAIESDDPRVRESALYALRQIGPAARAAQESLVKSMQADDSFDSLASAWALARIAPGDAAVASQAVPKLTHGLSSTDDQTRLESAEALAAWGAAAKPAAAALKRIAQQDEVAEVRAAATAALSKIAPGQ